MKLNGIELSGYFMDGERPCFELECQLSDIAGLDGKTLAVTDGGDTVEEFFGYRIDVINRSTDGTYFVYFARELEDASKEAIESLEESVNALHASVTEANSTAASAEQAAAEAKEAAAQAGTSPSVKAAAAMYVNASTTLTNTELGDVRELIDDFEPGGEYPKGAIRRYDGKYYRMAQAINSTTSQTYQPGTGTESLYTLIDLAPDGIRVWHMPTCAEDSFTLGEKAHYPDADGPIYVSGRVGNTSTPGTDEWWTLDGGEDD